MAAANEMVQEASQSTGNMLSLFSQVSAKSVERHVTSVMDHHDTEMESKMQTIDASRSKHKKARRRRAKLLKDAQREIEDMHIRQLNQVSKDTEDHEVTKDVTAYEVYKEDTGETSTEVTKEVK